jgi:drug/metabolite transporter (DMT)-like permease
MNIGLLYTPVSIYQMTRGALVLFVGTLSVLFLKRRLFSYQWFALMVVVFGVAIVGLSGSLTKQALAEPEKLLRPFKEAKKEEGPDEVAVIVGVFFVLFAQIGYKSSSCLHPVSNAILPAEQPSNSCWKRRSWQPIL